MTQQFHSWVYNLCDFYDCMLIYNYFKNKSLVFFFLKIRLHKMLKIITAWVLSHSVMSDSL